MSNCEAVLKQMLTDVKQHQRDPNSLLKSYVEQRLEKSLITYYSQLVSSVNSLSNFNEQNVLKKLTKEPRQ